MLNYSVAELRIFKKHEKQITCFDGALRRDFIYNAFVGIRELAGSDLVFR